MQQTVFKIALFRLYKQISLAVSLISRFVAPVFARSDLKSDEIENPELDISRYVVNYETSVETERSEGPGVGS